MHNQIPVLDNLLEIFSVNGINNGKRAENYNYIVKSMPKRLSFEHVDFIRQELDVHERDPYQIIRLLREMYDNEVATKSNPKSRYRSKYKPKARPAEDDSWEPVARLIQDTLKKKLSQKELIFIRDEITKNKTDPNDLFDIIVTRRKKKSKSVAEAAPAPSRISKKSSWEDAVKQIEEKLKIKLLPKEINFIKNEVINENTKPEMLLKIPFEATKLPKPPPLLPSVQRNISLKKKKNFKTNTIKTRKNVNLLREDMLRQFKKEKPFIADLNIPDKQIYEILKIVNYDFDEAANLLLQSM